MRTIRSVLKERGSRGAESRSCADKCGNLFVSVRIGSCMYRSGYKNIICLRVSIVKHLLIVFIVAFKLSLRRMTNFDIKIVSDNVCP
jgi:hypothetical protein